jgi:hypothetical protein
MAARAEWPALGVALLHHVRNARALVALLTSTSRDENQVGGNPPPNLPAARTSAN